MIPYSRNMPQRLTYWPPAANDGFGGVRYGQPQRLACRWQNTAQLFRTPEGREVVSQAVVYPACPVLVKGMLAFGEHDAAAPIKGAKEIQQVDISPSLGGAVALWKAYL